MEGKQDSPYSVGSCLRSNLPMLLRL